MENLKDDQINSIESMFQCLCGFSKYLHSIKPSLQKSLYLNYATKAAAATSAISMPEASSLSLGSGMVAATCGVMSISCKNDIEKRLHEFPVEIDIAARKLKQLLKYILVSRKYNCGQENTVDRII